MKNERTLRLTLWEECKSLKVFFQLFAAKLKKAEANKNCLLTNYRMSILKITQKIKSEGKIYKTFQNGKRKISTYDNKLRFLFV